MTMSLKTALLVHIPAIMTDTLAVAHIKEIVPPLTTPTGPVVVRIFHVARTVSGRI